MLDQLTIFLNTHSSYDDCWPMFFGQLNKHWPDHPPVVVAVNEEVGSDYIGGPENGSLWGNMGISLPRGTRVVDYTSDAPFGQQYLQGLSYVQTDYVLPLLEDMVLIGDVDERAIEEGVAFAAGRCEVRLTKITSGRSIYDRLKHDRWYTCEDVFTMQPTIHLTDMLLQDAVKARRAKTPWEWEPLLRGNPRMCVDLIQHGRKRGATHYDSPIFPFISTALNKGKWNTTEYPELRGVLREYGIDPSIRGET